MSARDRHVQELLILAGWHNDQVRFPHALDLGRNAYEAGYMAGRMDERRVVVAWLRRTGFAPETYEVLRAAAGDIADGAHLWPEKP